MQRIRYLFVHPIYSLIYVSVILLKKDYIQKVKIIEKDQLIEKIRRGTSLIRFGDGDIFIYHGGNQSYQKSSKKLRSKLKQIFSSTFLNKYLKKEQYIIGVPSRYLELSNNTLKTQGLLKCWLPFKIVFQQYFNKNAEYFDSHLFYETGSFETFILPSIINSNVLFVSNEQNLQQLKKQISSINLTPHFLPTKETDSFEEYENIVLKVRQYKEKYPDLKVILATGTTSKIIAFNLAREGVTCYDIGWGILYTKGENELQKQLIFAERNTK